MADRDGLPDGDDVARLCGRGVDNGIVTAAAFAPRPVDQNRLSVDWVQCPYAAAGDRGIEGSRQRL